jgi:murein DD-endopeptidase MepM/ murein hydrolase activator NlpD
MRRVYVPKQQVPDGYRGSRRLPKLPTARYAGVVLTAIMGSVLVVLGATAVMPDHDAQKYAENSVMEASLNVNDRLNAADAASRSGDRPGSAASVEQGKPDLWVLPMHYNYEITTLFAMRWGVLHNGVDLAAPLGTPYYATHDGIVLKAGDDGGGYGNEIMLDNGNGIIAIYGHGSVLFVHVGDHVKAGQNIGLVGSTGFSTGDHLHYEIHINADWPKSAGTLIDPVPFMKDHGVDIPRHLDAASGAVITS